MIKLQCHVLDAAGGQCTALYPEKPIYDVPGFPRIEVAKLIVGLTAQAASFRPVYHLGAGRCENASLMLASVMASRNSALRALDDRTAAFRVRLNRAEHGWGTLRAWC
jgi:hypothetical protein